MKPLPRKRDEGRERGAAATVPPSPAAGTTMRKKKPLVRQSTEDLELELEKRKKAKELKKAASADQPLWQKLAIALIMAVNICHLASPDAMHTHLGRVPAVIVRLGCFVSIVAIAFASWQRRRMRAKAAANADAHLGAHILDNKLE
eukprot:COSAG01_NODE_13321_length_1601_cov_2.113848_2_plen_146_part_00